MISNRFGERHEGNDQPGALVTGADYRGLGIARSLGRRNIPVRILRQGGQALAVTSRYVRHSSSWTGYDEAQRVDFLLNLQSEYGLRGWVLFPTDDEAVGLIARHHAALAEHYRLTTLPWETLRRLSDKRLLHDLAGELGIDKPRTFYLRSRKELTEFECAFPVVLKPTHRETFNRLTTEKAWKVCDRQSLLDRYDEACALFPPDMIMIQELVPGGGEAQFSYAALCLEGRPLAWLVARRTRQFPMEFGRFSTYVETVDEDRIIEPSVRLLESIRYTGLVEVEFKRDSRDGRYKLLDVNPRVWGWHTLGARLGVDFAYWQWQLARGEQVPEVRVNTGVRWVMLSRDLPMAALQILRGHLSLRSYLRSLTGSVESAVFALDDPLPGLLELPLLGFLLGTRLWAGRGI